MFQLPCALIMMAFCMCVIMIIIGFKFFKILASTLVILRYDIFLISMKSCV